MDVLKSRVSPGGWAWFEEALRATVAPVQENTLLGYYTGASRRLGKRALLLDEGEKARLQLLNPDLPVNHWGADEAGRAVLLLSLSHLPPDDYAELVLQCYELGDSREQESWLRALSLLPDYERFLSTAVDACRTNIIPLFEAIACENPYPCRYFPDLNFNQLVMKSLFNSIAISRIIGLDSRFNPELSCMTDDYVSEREAAGRQVPSDIWLVLAPRIQPDRLDRVHRYLHHENPNHRYWAAVGLGYTHAAGSRAALEDQRNTESEPRVRMAIDASLAKMGQ